MKISKDAQMRLREQEMARDEKERADARKNRNFLQVEKSSLKQIRRLAIESPKAMQLLLIFAEKMNKENALMISVKALQELTGMGTATIGRAVRLLRDEQWIKVIKVGTTNAYIMNNSVFWQSRGDLKFSHFRANIVASSSEQDPGVVENWSAVKLKQFPFVEVKETAEEGGQILISGGELAPPDQGEMDL